jgi:hypothetical protein
MKTYKIWAEQMVYIRTTVEAESQEEAWDIALATGDWEEYDGAGIDLLETEEVA